MLLPETVCNSVVSVATEDGWFLCATRWTVIGPRHFHFTIATQLTEAALAGQKFDKLTCWKGGIQWRCNVEGHWALQWGHSTANVCLWRLHGGVLDFYTPASNMFGWNSRLQSFEGMSTYFCIYSLSQYFYCYFILSFLQIFIKGANT
jgi:hypothetical protein